MEALTGKKTRKRKYSSASDKSEDSTRGNRKAKPAKTSVLRKEIIPKVFKDSLGFIRKKVQESEHLVNPDDLNTFKSIPCDTEAALLNLRASFPGEIFEGKLPPVFMYSQLSSLVHSRAVIDHQLKKLATENKILTFSPFTSSNYLIVFYSDFVAIKREGVFQRFVNEVLGEEEKKECEKKRRDNSTVVVPRFAALSSQSPPIRRSTENSKLISKESLLKKWKFEEDEVRRLVNAGYLGIQDGKYYCISLPGAGEFIKVYERGKKAVVNSIRKAKFGEILQRELEQRPMKKTVPLGVPYHIFDLVGLGEVLKMETTSGPLLRIKRELQ